MAGMRLTPPDFGQISRNTRMGLEQHSDDWSHHIYKDGGRGWGIVFNNLVMHSYPTREQARVVIRTYKADPKLAEVDLVMDL